MASISASDVWEGQRGVHCAVGYLLHRSGMDELVGDAPRGPYLEEGDEGIDADVRSAGSSGTPAFLTRDARRRPVVQPDLDLEFR